MIYNIEYELFFDIEIPSFFKKLGYTTSCTIYLFETDSNQNRISMIGTYNFKVKSKTEEKINEEIVKKIQNIIILRHDTKHIVEKKFNNIIKNF